MRKLKMLVLVLVGLGLSTLTSCEKESQDCNCGLVTDDGIDTQNSQLFYWVEIRNDCTDNIKRFYLTQGDWMNAHPGSDFCILNETWKTTPFTNGDEKDKIRLQDIKLNNK